VLLFGIPDEKDAEGSRAWDDDGVIQRALRALRETSPGLVLLTDVCLCEYTSHGHCGVLEGDEVDNDATLELLARTAVSHAAAGADAVCPSDMMDGRVAAIRAALDEDGHGELPIVSYAAKYASAFYGPFREAVESALEGDRRTYQQDPGNRREPFREAADSTPAFGDRRGYQLDPANVREALRECELDVAEGADALLVKPALPNLDVIRAVRERFELPVGAYNVSGEYAMLKAAGARGWLDERQAALESLVAIKRAGADLVVSYWTKELAGWL
jgi:porphobilinogen synthase